MTTTDKLPFPPNLPPLPEPPAGHEWHYRGMGARIAKGRKYICGDGKNWDKRPSECGSMADIRLHYAEAVPVSIEPDYQDRAYQKRVLDAAWNGADCQFRTSESSEWIDEDSWASAAASLFAGYEVRIKPAKKRIPLTAEDIPAVCWLRQGDKDHYPILVLQVMPDAIFCKVQVCQSLGTNGDVHRSYQELMDGGWEYSPDRRNWTGCFKEVEA